MKKKLLLAFTIPLLFASPVQAEDGIFQSILNDIERLKEVTRQKLNGQTDQLNILTRELKKVNEQNQQINDDLFGKAPNIRIIPNVQPVPFSAYDSNDPGPLAPPMEGVYIQPNKPLIGSVNTLDYQIDKMVDTALASNPEAADLQKLIDKYSTPLQRTMAAGKDAFNYVIPYRGFGPSNDASILILNDDVKLKTLSAVQYKQQQLVDKTHMELMSTIMQLAEGIGAGDKQAIEMAQGELGKTIGVEATLELVSSLQSTDNSLAVDEKSSTLQQKEEQYRSLISTAMDKDVVILDISKRLKKYQPSKNSMLASKIIMPALGAGSMVPMFVGPVARLALVAYVFANGGDEATKIIKELLLDKMLENRANLISEEAHLVLDGYQTALLTRNPVLLKCSKTMLDQMKR